MVKVMNASSSVRGRKLINGLSRKLTWKHSLDLGILNITLRITKNVRSVNGVGMAC